MTVCLRAQDLEWREIDDEIVALDARDALYLSANGSGALIWRLLSESTTREALVATLVETYQIDSTRAAGDVDDFLATLGARGLLAS